MKKIIPIANIVASIAALAFSLCGIAFAILTRLSTIFAPFAIVIIVVGFTISVISCSVGFAFTKSKLCITAGIISAVSMFIGIASFIVII
ncbi:MAG: hypothetical protein J1F36_01755 [Clostridiales bacterium]|nr:hypothetical protein [Clostridiales bacterium]